MPVGRKIGSPAHHIKETVQVGFHGGMEVVVHPATGGLLRTACQIAHQRGVYRLNLFFHDPKTKRGFLPLPAETLNLKWRPLGDSNPCCMDENHVS